MKPPNKTIIFLSLLCFLLTPLLVLGQKRVEQIPKSIESALDKRFPGWKLAEVSEEIRQFLMQHSAEACPNLIRGDFDGNGQLDYAILIIHGPTPNLQQSIVGFLRKGNRFKLYVLETNPASPARYLLLAKNNTTGHDFHDVGNFKYANDSIELFGQHHLSYIYENGKFTFVLRID